MRFTVSPSETLSQSPKSTAPTLSSSRFSASPTTSCGSSSISSDMQLSIPCMRAIPSPISSTVPTSERSADSASMPSIRSRRIDAISSGLISIAAFVSFPTPLWATLFLSFSSLFRMLVSKTMFPTCTTSPPRMSGSTRLSSSTVLPVCSSISEPIRSAISGSSSTALVTVTPSRLFSLAQSESKWRRIRKRTGIRCFSSSRSRKLTSSGSAPETAFARPSSFSADEK